MNNMDNGNILKGILGAIIGTIPGIILWVILSKIGIIASICGIAILIGSVVGYTALGKSLNKIGLIISLIIVVIAVYFATNLSWALELYSILKDEDSMYTLSWCMNNLSWILEVTETKGNFIRDLVFGYLLTIIGGVSYVAKLMKRN